METFFTVLHFVSWLIFLLLIPLTAWALWLKTRSSVQCWVRLHEQPERWLMYAEIDGDSSEKQQNAALQTIVEQARNCEWDASCTFRQREPDTRNWVIGLVSHNRPDCTDDNFRKLPATQVIRASGQPRDDSVSVSDEVHRWAKKHGVEISGNACSLSAQSFQCWQWNVAAPAETPQEKSGSRFNERVFEIRDIALYPIIITAFTLAMLGTGSSWLFGIGIFSIILLSGAHKFVFLHQREDATQESHLQNY